MATAAAGEAAGAAHKHGLRIIASVDNSTLVLKNIDERLRMAVNLLQYDTPTYMAFPSSVVGGGGGGGGKLKKKKAHASSSRSSGAAAGGAGAGDDDDEEEEEDDNDDDEEYGAAVDLEDELAGKTTVASVTTVLTSLPKSHLLLLDMCLQLAQQTEKLALEAQAKALGKLRPAKPNDDAPLPTVIWQKLLDFATGRDASTNSKSFEERLDQLRRAGLLQVAGQSVKIAVPRIHLQAALHTVLSSKR